MRKICHRLLDLRIDHSGNGRRFGIGLVLEARRKWILGNGGSIRGRFVCRSWGRRVFGIWFGRIGGMLDVGWGGTVGSGVVGMNNGKVEGSAHTGCRGWADMHCNVHCQRVGRRNLMALVAIGQNRAGSEYRPIAFDRDVIDRPQKRFPNKNRNISYISHHVARGSSFP